MDRWHGTDPGDVELHMFCDASETAIAALCYVVQRRADETVVRSLVMAKCLVAPLKAKSIPRLELDAAVLAVRVYRMVIGTEERLRHCLLLTERLINSRPLTEVPTDVDEEECLMPNHFMLGSSNGVKADGGIDEVDLRESLNRWGEVINGFWRRFTKEYLPLVSPRAK